MPMYAAFPGLVLDLAAEAASAMAGVSVVLRELKFPEQAATALVMAVRVWEPEAAAARCWRRALSATTHLGPTCCLLIDPARDTPFMVAAKGAA